VGSEETRWTARILAGGLLVLLLAATSPAAGQEAVIVVRHAEKLDDSDDPPLSGDGYRRAARLAGLLDDAGIDAIYGTERQRTIQTAQPLADRLGLEIGVVPRAGTDDLERRLRTQHADDVVLVVGHSDTVPGILSALGVRESVTIADADYDNVFVVIPRGPAAPTLLRLKVP